VSGTELGALPEGGKTLGFSSSTVRNIDSNICVRISYIFLWRETLFASSMSSVMCRTVQYTGGNFFIS
jgi:hypothetical protein